MGKLRAYPSFPNGIDFATLNQLTLYEGRGAPCTMPTETTLLFLTSDCEDALKKLHEHLYRQPGMQHAIIIDLHDSEIARDFVKLVRATNTHTCALPLCEGCRLRHVHGSAHGCKTILSGVGPVLMATPGGCSIDAQGWAQP